MLIAISRSDGGVSVMCVSEEADIAAEIKKWQTTFVGGYVSHRPIDASEIPADRTYRSAWTPDFKVDMVKAREVQRNYLRSLRRGRFAQLDVQWMKAVSEGDTKAIQEIEAQKQALRDAPSCPEIDAASTPEELKVAVPAVLSGA